MSNMSDLGFFAVGIWAEFRIYDKLWKISENLI